MDVSGDPQADFRVDQLVVEISVISLAMIVLDEFSERPAAMPLAHRHHAVQILFL
jgi:hypothetical protein